MKRREFLEVAGQTLLAGGAALNLPDLAWSASGQPQATRGTNSQRPPNILFILSDDLGYGELGCYGQDQILTPHIDRLAAEGTRFTQCYAASTVCAPSRTGLLTGLHTGHTSIRGNKAMALPANDYTVAQLLKSAGYATGVIGKWGLGAPGTSGDANKHGFDEFYGYTDHVAAHNAFPLFLWHNQEKVSLEGNKGGKQGQYSNDLFQQQALDFITRHKAQPFFLYLNYTIPHANSTGRTIEAPRIEPEYENKPWPELEKRYASTITRMDNYVDQIRQRLTALGIADNTLIIFTSDNGPHQEGGHKAPFFHSNRPLRGIKRDLYEGGIRVPMIASWPGHIKAGAVSDQVWAFWDFLPTAAAIAGKPAPANIDGISMLPALLGKPQQNHDYLYWEFYERGFEQAVRLGDWKAVRHGLHLPIELYDLKADLGEKNNIAAQHPEVVAKVADILKAAHTDSPQFPIPADKSPASPLSGQKAKPNEPGA
ncbi:MAG: arylsulfatase [Abitibacteriaceae bacterium]|nr:arylsulfatase [Abditibacteriaceae bacterium]